jgi:hypothetical protein
VLSLPRNSAQTLKRMISTKIADTKTAPMKIQADLGLRGGHSMYSHIEYSLKRTRTPGQAGIER